MPYGNTFQVIKEIPITEVARRYLSGLDLRQRGNRHVSRCPWHSGGQEKAPSLTFYSDNSWWCFGCNHGGSVIDLVMQAQGIDFKEACRTLASDWGLEWGRPLTKEERQRAREAARKREIEKAFQTWCHKAYLQICILVRCIDKVIYQDPGQVEELAGILNMEPIWIYWLDILQNGTKEQKFLLFTNEAVNQWLIPLT